jgi:hypothetical protein
MKNIKFKLLTLGTVLLLVTSSCINDLDTEPKYDYTLEQLIAQDPNAVEGLLSRLYASYALSSVRGAGESDVAGADAGESPFIRGLVNLEDFTADGMKNRWGDNGLDQLTTTSNWTDSNKFFRYVYDRLYYIIPQATNLILILNKNDVNYAKKAEAVGELKFLRALAYYYIIDLFGKGVLVTDDNFGTTTALPESSRTELFNYVESQLIEAEAALSATSSYGRANKAAAQFLLAKLYINSEVYTGTNRYSNAVPYLNKVIAAGYSLETNFSKNFRTDNNTSKEIIFPLIADAISSQSFGNTTYIIQGGLSIETMTPQTYGSVGPDAGAWAGHRATKAWYGLFGNSAAALTASTDQRAKLFWTTGHNYEMTDYKIWKDGYPSIKFQNVNTSGTGTASVFVSTDFPLFRLSDAYLMYAECAMRGAAGADMALAQSYFNQVRNRANAAPLTLSLQNILDERGRELNLEGVRRQDLIRFGKFTGGTYLWPWKGGVANGTSISENYKVFPIPATALQANPNQKQNTGY